MKQKKNTLYRMVLLAVEDTWVVSNNSCFLIDPTVVIRGKIGDVHVVVEQSIFLSFSFSLRLKQ